MKTLAVCLANKANTDPQHSWEVPPDQAETEGCGCGRWTWSGGRVGWGVLKPLPAPAARTMSLPGGSTVAVPGGVRCG